MTIYLCNRCEILFGRYQTDCDNEYCGKDYEDVKNKL